MRRNTEKKKKTGFERAGLETYPDWG